MNASFDHLRRRAAILGDIRQFFADHDVCEVETPRLVPSPGVDRHIDALPVGSHGYLATSPEYHMKRLLAAGSGPIYQLGRAFRADERGALHNPEFTILEWYQPGWDHTRLMGQVEALLVALAARHAPEGPLATTPFARVTFAEVFLAAAGFDPHTAGAAELRAAAARRGAALPALDEGDRDGWSTYLQATAVEPTLGLERPTFVDRYPADQCALARVTPGDPPVAERFELYVGGIELANGFTELTDADEQRARIERENAARRSAGRPTYPVDEAFVEALRAMPEAAGVAVGVDRVVMLLLGATSIDEVMAFPGAVDARR